MKGRYVAFVLAVVAFLGALVSWFAVPAAPRASAQGGCGPVGQPCTWNFSPVGAGGGGADVYNAQAAGREGSGTLVAVVDTWVDPNHPAFGGRVVDEADCVGAAGNPAACQDHKYAPDACTHGTHVAGTIASSNYGVAPRASILAVQTLTADSSGDCSGDATDVAAGVLFAAAHGARVINLSVGDLVPGFTQDSTLTSAVHQAAAAGSLVIFASGNSNCPVTDSYGSDALLVAATGPSGQLAGYSNSGNLAAPGGDDGTSTFGCVPVGFSGNGCQPSNCIASTLPGGQYGLMEGTSMAAPHVSGTAALLFGENPGRSRADVIHALEATAHPVSGGGSGLVDAAAALALEPAGAPAGSVPPRNAPPAASGSNRSVASAVRTSSPVRGVPAAAAAPAPSIASTTTSAPPPTSVPFSPYRLPSNDPGAPRHLAATAHGGSPGSSGSVAFAGAVAALLLLLSGAGTGVFALRRRS